VKLEDIRLVHAIPGRIRLKLERIKGDAEQARDIESRLATVRGIHQVEVSSLTGSVVATFDPALLESLDFHFAVASALGIAASDLNPEYLAKWYANKSNGSPLVSPNMGDHWRMLVPLALLALGIRGVVAAERLIFPQWYDYLWFAFGTYHALNPPVSSPPVASQTG
jgi:Heavy metal associated domain 2